MLNKKYIVRVTGDSIFLDTTIIKSLFILIINIFYISTGIQKHFQLVDS